MLPKMFLKWLFAMVIKTMSTVVQLMLAGNNDDMFFLHFIMAFDIDNHILLGAKLIALVEL